MNGGEEKIPIGSSNTSPADLSEEVTDEKDIESEIADILKTSERWSSYLRHKEQRKRILYSVLSGIMVWVALFILVALQDDLSYSIASVFPSSFLFGNSLHNLMSVIVFPASFAVAVIAYVVLTRIKSPLVQLEALIANFHSNSGEDGSAVSALGMLEKMIRLLPEVKKMRYVEAGLYGVIAFLLSLLITARSASFGTGASVLVGVLIWLYFRYEATIEYGRELTRFEKWQDKLEQQKREFIANL